MSGLPARYQKWVWAGVIGLCVAALFAGGAWAYLRQRDADAPPSSSVEDGTESSAGEEDLEEISPAPVTEDAVNLLVCGLDDAAGLTDVIMYVSFDVKAGRVDVLQIPRDTYIGDDYKTGKINQVYFAHKKDEEPILGLAGVIEQQFQLPVDHYLIVTLEAFRDLVDAIGGVEVDVPVRIEFLPDKVIEQGRQHLSGEQAEWFVRYRAGYKEGDIGRINAQKLMIDGLMRAVKEQGRSRMLRVAMRYFNQVETDLPLNDALSYANAAFQLEPQNLHMDTVEGRGVMYNGYAVYEVYKQKLIDLLNERFRPYREPVYFLPVAQIPPPPSKPESIPEESEPDGSSEEEPEEEQPDQGDNRSPWEQAESQTGDAAPLWPW